MRDRKGNKILCRRSTSTFWEWVLSLHSLSITLKELGKDNLLSHFQLKAKLKCLESWHHSEETFQVPWNQLISKINLTNQQQIPTQQCAILLKKAKLLLDLLRLLTSKPWMARGSSLHQNNKSLETWLIRSTRNENWWLIETLEGLSTSQFRWFKIKILFRFPMPFQLSQKVSSNRHHHP